MRSYEDIHRSVYGSDARYCASCNNELDESTPKYQSYCGACLQEIEARRQKIERERYNEQ